jgi:hypothetical protein
MSVVDDVNKSVGGAKTPDLMAIDAAEKAKILAQAKDLMKSAEAQIAEAQRLLASVDLGSPSDKFVPPKTPQIKSGGLGSTEVAQQTDQGKDGL